MPKQQTLKIVVTHCYDCPLGEHDRDVCMHPSAATSREPFSRDKTRVRARCPLHRGNVSIRLKKVKEMGKKKWTRQKLQKLLRLHEVEGLALHICGYHFEVAATHMSAVLEEARSWRSKRWYGWTDMLEKKGK